MRKLIAAMKISLDGKMEGSEGYAGWVEAWSDDYGLTPQIDACLIGGGMYPGYERYWTSLQTEPAKPMWVTGAAPTQAELDWAQFIKQTPHYVLSNSLTSAQWPDTRFLKTQDDVGALKDQPGKDIYLMGGQKITASLIEAGLVDEVRLIIYPFIAGKGRALFETIDQSRKLELVDVEKLENGKLKSIYAIV